MAWREELHPRRPDGEFTHGGDWATGVSRRITPVGHLFDLMHDPAFEDTTEHHQDQAHLWATRAMDSPLPGGFRAPVKSVQHNGDGIEVKGAFISGPPGYKKAGWYEFSVFRDAQTGQRTGSIEMIHLEKQYRGGGVAKQWAAHLEDVLRAEGVHHITMQDVSGGFWRSQGYRPGTTGGESVKVL